MKISVYGAGYVGLVSAVCLAKIGHHVICTDINRERIKLLENGECPIYEVELPELLKSELESKRIVFTTDVSSAIHHGQVHFIATGTPSLDDGSADLSQVFAVAKQIVAEVTNDIVLVIKSTVPVGTGDAIEEMIQNLQNGSSHAPCIEVVSNPEFLREGCAVQDFLQGDRIVVGGKQPALAIIKEVYKPLVDQGMPLLTMNRKSAELTKYAANAMLACRISFINEISRIAEKIGADIDEIKAGMGSDHRIGRHFLNAGIGYGGSCFPKDSRALIQTAKRLDERSFLLEAVEQINESQKKWAFEQLQKHFNCQLRGLTVGIWGLAFKPGTDDMREASSLVIIKQLLDAGARIRVFDPVAMEKAKVDIPPSTSIVWCESAEQVISNIDALIIATEWDHFKNYSLNTLKRSLKEAPLIDGRNCFELEQLKQAGLSYYYSVGRPLITNKNGSS